MLSNAKRPPQTKMLSATRTTSRGRTTIFVVFLPDRSIGHSRGLSIGEALVPSPERGRSRNLTRSGEGDLYCWRFCASCCPKVVPPPAHAFSISTRSLLQERARHQKTIAEERLMRHAPGRITGCRFHQSWTWWATIARAMKVSASTSTSSTRKIRAKEAAPNDFLFRYGKAMSRRLTWLGY